MKNRIGTSVMKIPVLCGDGVFFPEIEIKIPGNLKKTKKNREKYFRKV